MKNILSVFYSTEGVFVHVFQMPLREIIKMIFFCNFIRFYSDLFFHPLEKVVSKIITGFSVRKKLFV